MPGWFADSDGTGFIREEVINGRREYVMMEHMGPGCITKMWTPFFYYDFNNRVGPNVRIYLDGSSTPTYDESLIKLVRGEGSIPRPFAAPTARAGDSYLPIPFARSVKVTMVEKPFYNIINYRAYPTGTKVETFRKPKSYRGLPFPGQVEFPTGSDKSPQRHSINPGKSVTFKLPNGTNAIYSLKLLLSSEGSARFLKDRPELLRSTLISIRFDGENTVSVPFGDFFCKVDVSTIGGLSTWNRANSLLQGLNCFWTMPYRKNAEIMITNLGSVVINLCCEVKTKRWKWTKDSMHFYARWRPDDIVPGTPFQDWNFVDIQGKGVFVGDSFTVLNIKKDSWWGEGDEKIYVDYAWDKGFPTHFGTGTEDYYGWAGGVLPTKADEFHHPFLNNVKVGGLDGHTMGYNILTRERALDAIPFNKRLRFDMESSFGTDMRNKWNLLGYSAVTFFYALPGAKHNRPGIPDAARKPIMSVEQLQRMSDKIKVGG